jgi:hypothetical protein
MEDALVPHAHLEEFTGPDKIAQLLVPVVHGGERAIVGGTGQPFLDGPNHRRQLSVPPQFAESAPGRRRPSVCSVPTWFQRLVFVKTGADLFSP